MSVTHLYQYMRSKGKLHDQYGKGQGEGFFSQQLYLSLVHAYLCSLPVAARLIAVVPVTRKDYGTSVISDDTVVVKTACPDYLMDAAGMGVHGEHIWSRLIGTEGAARVKLHIEFMQKVFEERIEWMCSPMSPYMVLQLPDFLGGGKVQMTREEYAQRASREAMKA